MEYAKNAFDNILRNKTLEDLYAANGNALGMEFTTDEDVLRNASGESNTSHACRHIERRVHAAPALCPLQAPQTSAT